MASSSTNPHPYYPYRSEFDVSDYPYPSEFNVSDLVPDKLTESNYSDWKPLMLDFIESQGMDQFIHHPREDSKQPDYQLPPRLDRLLRRWILSTLSKDIIKQFLPYKTAREVWMALERKLGSRKQPDPSSKMEEAGSKLHSYMPLHIDAIQGDVQRAKDFIDSHSEAIKEPISAEGETALIIAIRSIRRNKLVKYLLESPKHDYLDHPDNLGRTALHEAAEVGNLEAAKLLLKPDSDPIYDNSDLLYIADNNGQTPLLDAAKTGNREMVRFLLDCVKGSGVLEACRVPPTLLYHLANSGLYDIALELLQQFPELACPDTSMSTGTETSPLMAMSQKRSTFRSGAPLNSFEKYIYSTALAKLRNNATKNPAVNENRQNPPAVTDIENPVDENPQSGAVNPAVNENRRNPPAVTDIENPVDENPQSGAVNPAVNENRPNPPAVTDIENPVDENPQSGAVTDIENPVDENPQSGAVNPAVNKNRPNPPAVTDIENPVDENPQSGAVNPAVNENRQNPSAVTDTENPIADEKAIADEDVQNDTSSIGMVQQQTAHTSSIGTAQQQTAHTSSIGTAQQQTGRWHAIHWPVADESVRAIKHIREMYRKKNKHIEHHEALQLVKCLCKEIAKSDFSTATWIFTPALAQATSSGIHEIVEEILRSYPAAISFKNENNQSIFQSAIVWRRENVFNLIYQLKECSHKFLSVPDRFGNNALHLAGCLGPQQHLSVRVSAAGAALQMQRELQWFKEVEKFVLPQDKECRNADGMTPAEVFTKTHKELVEAGERWMKDTATSCTIVAALIATVMFAAAITVPGGNNASRGVSIFSKQKAFIIFGLSDALALFTSIASLLMFLSILTARYAEEDFLYSLPNRLIIGLINLFLSISSTMTAFGATLYLMFGENRRWTLYPIVAFACIPVTLFVFLLFPLLKVMCKSTYRPAIFGKQSDYMLF